MSHALLRDKVERLQVNLTFSEQCDADIQATWLKRIKEKQSEFGTGSPGSSRRRAMREAETFEKRLERAVIIPPVLDNIQ